MLTKTSLNMTRSYPLALDSETNSDHYVELGVIGNGAYGTVYKARHKLNENQIVALKKIRVPFTEDGLPLSTMREIALLRQLDRHEHPNIIRLLDICQGPKLEKEQQLILYIVFEHVDQDLATYMEKCSPSGLLPSQVKSLMSQILCGLDFLHSHRVLHRDLKPQNLLITKAGNIKVADFGLAKTYDFEMRLTTVVVTLWYRSPEVLLGSTYATPLDVWSCGCIMAEMLMLTPLFSGTSEGDQLDRIFRVIGTPKESEWPENVSIKWNSFAPRQGADMRAVIPKLDNVGVRLIKRMLQFDPNSRITAAEALKHEYFMDNDYEVPKVSNRVWIPFEDSSSENTGVM